jgi:hypothetical protein
MESTGTALQDCKEQISKLKIIENLRSAICNSERSEDKGGLQATDPLTALGRTRASLE